MNSGFGEAGRPILPKSGQQFRSREIEIMLARSDAGRQCRRDDPRELEQIRTPIATRGPSGKLCERIPHCHSINGLAVLHVLAVENAASRADRSGDDETIVK